MHKQPMQMPIHPCNVLIKGCCTLTMRWTRLAIIPKANQHNGRFRPPPARAHLLLPSLIPIHPSTHRFIIGIPPFVTRPPPFTSPNSTNYYFLSDSTIVTSIPIMAAAHPISALLLFAGGLLLMMTTCCVHCHAQSTSKTIYVSNHIATPHPTFYDRRGLLRDGLACNSSVECSSQFCTQNCCGLTYRLESDGRCHRGSRFDGAICSGDAECFSNECDKGVCVSKALNRRLLAETGSVTLPNSGIPFALENLLGYGGFRFVSNVQGVPMLMDTGSSSIIFCNSISVTGASLQSYYGCDNYGIAPNPTNLPTLYGAASNVYLTSPTSGLTLQAMGSNSYSLTDANYKTIVSSSSGLTFCVDGLGGIFGMAGDRLNDVSSPYVAFPQCTIDSNTYEYLPSAFPALVTSNDNLFGIYLDYTDMRGQVLLGTDATALATLKYSQSLCTDGTSGSTTNYTFTLVGTFGMTGYDGSNPVVTAFPYYQSSVTSCGLRGYSQISLSGYSVIFDTG